MEKKLVEGEEEAGKSLADVTGLGDKVKELEDQIVELENKLGSEKGLWKEEEVKWRETKAVSIDVKPILDKWMLRSCVRRWKSRLKISRTPAKDMPKNFQGHLAVLKPAKRNLV